MTKIIAAIDNSAAARPVIAAAEAVAHVLGSTVEALHVREDGEVTARGEAEAANVEIRTIIDGTPSDEILEAVAANDVVAVVVGARRTPGGARPAGHVALDVITAVGKPAVVVPPEAPIKDKIHSALVPMMGRHPAQAASVRSTIELVNASHIEVIVLHVYDEETIPSFSDQAQYETQEWAQEFLARYVPIPPESVRLELRVGVPIEQIIRVCDETSADMVAMGWAQSLAPGRGQLVRAVLERSTVPVILLPVLAGPERHEG